MKKFLSMLLVAAMLLSFMPAFSLQAAAADETEEVIIQEPETRAPETKAATQAVSVIDLDGVPDSIAPGAAEIPSIHEYEDDVTITDVKWLDLTKQPVTEFENGVFYWLAVTVVPDAGYAFTERPNRFYTNSKEYEFQLISQQEAVVYLSYTPKATVGDVDVTVTGIREGAAAADVSAEVSGNAVLISIEIQKRFYNEAEACYDYVDASDDIFEAGNIYEINYHLQATDGYQFDGDYVYTVNGEWASYSDYGEDLWLYTYFSTSEEIGQAELLMTEILPGTKVEDVELTVPAGVNYEVEYYHFRDEDDNYLEEADTFQEGQRYEFYYSLAPKMGYAFAERVSATVNGAKVNINSNIASTYTWVYFGFDAVETIRLGDIPYGIEVGTAEIPEMYDYSGDDVTITGVQWVDDRKQPVTEFEEGGVYYLAVTVTTGLGVTFAETPEINIPYDVELTFEKRGEKEGVVYIRYSLEPDAGDLEITTSGVQVGASIANIQAAVTGNASVKEIQVYEAVLADGYYEDVLTEDSVFKTGKVYEIHYVLTPDAGHRFGGDFDVMFNGEHTYPDYSNAELRVYEHFSTCEKIEKVELTVTGLVPGAKREDVEVTVPADANYLLLSNRTYFENCNDYSDRWDTFQQDGEYILYYEIIPKQGYCFNDFTVYVNGTENHEYSYYVSGLGIEGDLSISFYVEEVELRELPYDIWEGAEEDAYIWNAEDLEVVGGDAVITKTQWVGADKQPVTRFEDGKAYYLAITLAPTGVRKFSETPEISFDYWDELTYVYEFKIVSETEAILYVRYSLEPGAGDVNVQVSGLQEGANIEDVTASVTGNATVREIRVYQGVYYEEDGEYSYNQVTEGRFEAQSNYRIEYILETKPGYSWLGSGITVNGKEVDNYSTSGGNMIRLVATNFSTCEKIEKVTLTMPEVAVGKNFDDLKVTVPENANYTVSYYWEDATDSWEEAAGQVTKKHRYYLSMTLTPKEGYVLAQNLEVTLNGEQISFEVNEDGLGAYTSERYSFLEKITKIELPAMPKSVALGSTLPTNFSVADSKNYTVSGYWVLNYEIVEKATEKGIYTLVLFASPKEGYEFAEDAKVYVGGKLAEETNIEDIYCAAYGTYYVGLEKISKVELTFTEPEDGKPVSTVKVPSSAKYSIVEQYWGQSTDGEMESAQLVDTYIKDQHLYLMVSMKAKDGYVITADTEFYLNGKKTTSFTMGGYDDEVYLYFYLGVVSAFKKLATPEVTKDGVTLNWNAVAYANSYEVYRATSKSGKYTKVATVTEPTWQDDAAAGKTYYYKVKAIYTADTDKNSGYSSVVSIDYKCEAPVITVANGDTGKPVVSWEKVEGAKQYTVYRATSENGKYTKLKAVKTLSYTDTKAAAGTTYYYKVIANASSSKYNSGYSNIVSCGVICGTPTVTVKIDAATGKPSLSWKKVDGAVNYRILRQLPGEETFTEIAKQTGVTFADTTAPIDTVCQYQVQALGKTEELNGAVSKTVTATSGIARPAMKTSIDSVSGKPTFTWEAVEGAVKYEIYRSTKSTKGYTLLATVEATSYVDETVAAGKTYYYKMVAIGEVSKSAETAYVKLTGKCAVPTISAQIDADSGKPTISWEKVEGAKQYTVYRATSETGKYSKLKSVKTLSYTDTKATAGTQYFYKVIANASSSKNNSGYSNIVSCNVICGRPTVSIKTDAATGKPVLSWSKVTGAAGYRILRQLPGEETFAVIAEQTAVTFLDTTAPIDTQCVYMVQVLGKTDALDSMLSEELTVTSGIARPAMKASVDATSGKPSFTWEAVEGAVKYEIYRSTKSTKGYTLLATVEGTSYEDDSVAAGKTYYYKMVAIGENGKSAETAYVKLTGKCATPAISVQLHETTGKPVISWEKITGAKQYTVYRATSENGTYKKLGTTKNLSYTDSKAVPGTEYYYKIVANGSKSSYNSSYSNVVSAVGYAAQPQVTLKNDSKGKPVVSWKKISEAEKYIVVYVDITDAEDESELTEQFILENLQYVEVSKKKTSVTLTQAQTGRLYLVCVVAIPKNEEFFAISQIGYVAATCAAPKISGKYLQGYNCGTWKAVEGAEYYAIYRSTKASGGYELLGYIDNDSSFVDLSAVKGKTYYYKVTACTEYTESEFSNYIKLKTK